jgi:hypothetical protein
MIRPRLVPVAVLVVIGSGCGVGVDATPRPLEPISSLPLQPTPTVVERPDDRVAGCLPSSTRPAPPSAPPSTLPPSSSPPEPDPC